MIGFGTFKSISHAIIAGSLALGAVSATADIYKYKDANGNWVFSEKAPSDAQNVETIEAQVTGPSEDALEKLEDDKARADELREARLKRAEEAAAEAEKAKKLSRNCDIARRNLDRLQSATRTRYVNENNEREFYTEEARQQRIREAREQIEEFCKG